MNFHLDYNWDVLLNSVHLNDLQNHIPYHIYRIVWAMAMVWVVPVQSLMLNYLLVELRNLMRLLLDSMNSQHLDLMNSV